MNTIKQKDFLQPNALSSQTPPHSDQAATTPDVLKLLSDFTNKHYAMAADEHCEGYPGPSVRKRYDESIAAEYALIEAIRAQSAELLALRADKQRLDWLESHPDNQIKSLRWKGRPVFWPDKLSDDTFQTIRQAIDAALNSPTQKSPTQ